MTKSKTQIVELKGVGKQLAHRLARLNIFEIKDLLFHFPTRYQDRTQLQSIRYLKPNEEAVIEGVMTLVTKPSHGRTKLLCELQDETGKLHLRFFHVLSFQFNILQIGTRLRCYGTVRLGQKGLEMFHPEFQVITADNLIPMEEHLTPIYPATEGISQHMLRKLSLQALTWMQNSFTDLVPQTLLQTLPRLQEALHFVHQPPSKINLSTLMNYQSPAQKRLIIEELLAQRISLLQLKKTIQQQTALALPLHETIIQQFIQSLPFQLTTAQSRVLKEVQTNLIQSHPMLRLVQGDVGSGKTIIAALAMLQAATNQYQAVLMAPTELLAEQHYHTMQKWFAPFSIEVVLLTGQTKARAQTLQMIENGKAKIIVGTHALYQEKVIFNQLALIVIDEQHRFGVGQRDLLRKKGEKCEYYPHQLMMTATPIPRTLAMSFYADLDCSTIDELPPGRTPIITSVMANHRREEIIARIREACQQGRQVYWVCPLIEESDVLTCQSAIATADMLQHNLSELKTGLIHGKLRAQEKENIMRAFKLGEIKVLVATTVIEVGVDVPNASVMIIENAERLGLSQLHQLRGRVGRGTTESYCILLYQSLNDIAKERLQVMRETTIGFDTGPGNTLMDSWIHHHQQKSHDEHGAWAAQGKCQSELLKNMLRDTYFKRTPPKSTGREYFNFDWLKQFSLDKITPVDVQATLAELTAQTILDAIHTVLSDKKADIFICGGGAHNDFLMKRLQQLAQPHFSVASTKEIGVDPDWIEAMAFAWFARQTLQQATSNLPDVTGAKRAAILGGIYYP